MRYGCERPKWRPLLKAVSSGCVGAVKMLVDAGADIDCRGGKPLLIACIHMRAEVIRILLDGCVKADRWMALARTFLGSNTAALEVFLDHESFDPPRDARVVMEKAVKYGALKHAELILCRYGNAFKQEDYMKWQTLTGVEILDIETRWKMCRLLNSYSYGGWSPGYMTQAKTMVEVLRTRTSVKAEYLHV